MLQYAPYYLPNDNTLRPIFNVQDFQREKEAATLGDLLSYANLSGYNVFTGNNSFTVIDFNEALNGIKPSEFSFLSGLQINIQNTFSSLLNKTTKQSFNSGTGITLFDSILQTPVFILNGRNLETRILTIEDDVSRVKTKTSPFDYVNNVLYINGTVSIDNMMFKGSNLDTRLQTNETNIQTNKDDISTLKSTTLIMNTDITKNKSDIATLKSSITDINVTVSQQHDDIVDIQTTLQNGVVNVTTDQLIDGKKTFIQRPMFQSLELATTQDVTNMKNQILNGAGPAYDTLGELQTILVQDQNNITTILNSMVTLTGAQSISGQKIFTSLQTFGSMTASTLSIGTITFTGNINGISTSVFSRLSGLTSNIQTQLNSLFTTVTNMVYDTASQTRRFLNNTAFQNINGQSASFNDYQANNVTTNNIVADTITVSTLKLANPLLYPVAYIFNANATFFIPPKKNLRLLSDLNGFDGAEPMAFTLTSYSRLMIYDENKSCLLNLENDTDDYMNNVAFTFTVNPVYYYVDRTRI